MVSHQEQRLLAYPPQRIFDLVADVESYPRFLPLWRKAEIIHRDADRYFTDQEIGIGPACHRFRSKTTLARPERIEIVSSDALFRHFDIRWEFAPADNDSCRVEFALSCEARSNLVQKAFDTILDEMVHSMVNAFERRARELYGPPVHSTDRQRKSAPL